MAPLFDRDQRIGRDRLDLGHDDVRPLGGHQRMQRDRVGHVDHVGAVGDLVPRRPGIAVDRDRLDAEPLQRDQHFLTKFSCAQKHHPRRNR